MKESKIWQEKPDKLRSIYVQAFTQEFDEACMDGSDMRIVFDRAGAAAMAAVEAAVKKAE